MAFVTAFDLFVFVVYLLKYGSTYDSSSRQTICAFKTTSTNNPALFCLLFDLKCSSKKFIEMFAVTCRNYRYSSACQGTFGDWCSFDTDCCLRNSWRFQYNWSQALSPFPYNCLRKPRCHQHASMTLHTYSWLPAYDYHCSASYQCVSEELSRTKTLSSTTPSTTKTTAMTSEKTDTSSIGSRTARSETTNVSLSDQEKEESSVIKRQFDLKKSTEIYTDVSDTYSSPAIAAIVVPVVLVALAVGAGVPLLLWKRRMYGKSKHVLKSNNLAENFKRESNQYETICAQPKSSSRNIGTKGLQSSEVTDCSSIVQNNPECHDGIKAVGYQGYLYANLEQNDQCSYINSGDLLKQGLHRSKEQLTSRNEYNNTNFLKTRFENVEKQAGLKILNPRNLLENEKCSYVSTPDVLCREVVVENNPDIGYKHFKTEEFEKENHPYFILEPQSNKNLQVPTSHLETSTASENIENEYNRIRFTKANVILDDNYAVVSYNASEFPVNNGEYYSHLGDDVVTVKNATDYSHIRLVKQVNPDEKADYCNLEIKR